jgi:choline dehydrogenase-like flavoprotein
LSTFLDARRLPSGTTLTPDLAIIGGGPAGISLALALKDTPFSIALLEAGGTSFDPKGQNLYRGAESGLKYVALDAGRLRFLGGGSNPGHWGGYCRPLDAIDFESRDWVPHSGWPFGIDALEPYFPRAQALVEAGPWLYDKTERHLTPANGAPIALGEGGIYTSWFQFSKTRGGTLPTAFGQRYGADLKAAPRITTYLNAGITALRLAPDGGRIVSLDGRTLAGNSFAVKPRFTVLATGAIENARLLLASNDVMKTGVGNQNDLVGRFFADHPIPRNVATLVLFAGAVPEFYDNASINNAFALADGTLVRAVFSPTAAYAKREKVVGSLTTIENPVTLDETGVAAVVATSQALGIDASDARAYTVGCGMELMPDPDRRLTLTGEKDALGMPRPNLNIIISDRDFALYRKTLAELGRQLLASRVGMLRLNYHDRAGWLEGMSADKQSWWGNHHLGTTRMSNDPKQGVVDANAQVHGVGNLYVAGSSVFPTYGSSNPTMNLLALTLRLADHLKEVMA